jgi:hypothetical protein
MLDQVIVELMKMEQKNIYHAAEQDHASINPVQVKLPLRSRVFSTLGDALIGAGMKIKQYSRPKLAAETAELPNFMIML